MTKLKCEIQRSFGGWCISIDNGYTVTYHYDVPDNIITIIKQLAEENKELKAAVEEANENAEWWRSRYKAMRKQMEGKNE